MESELQVGGVMGWSQRGNGVESELRVGGVMGWSQN